MLDQENLEAMEEVVVEHAGPLGKFVIKKSMADMGKMPGDYNRESLDKLVDMVLERAVYDSSKWKVIKKEIFAAMKD